MSIADTPEYPIIRLKAQIAANNVIFALERLAPRFGSALPHTGPCPARAENAAGAARFAMRIDTRGKVLHDNTVCVYDLKTGNRGITVPRAVEIYESVRRRFKTMPEVRIVEVNPGR
ncbi:hypothetical protein [Phyllobacterium zundukense]|uniref:hypothetical protein n=1 Tax=Phyllobacterium zundukense TaxID=1867719 RepID=UPI001054E076|nr:hypothetical protein [Phyllobacterium zundukense]